MRVLTHVLVGIFVSKLFGLDSLIDVLLASIGSALPDVDLSLGLRHRTITHSLVFILACSGVCSLFGAYALPLGMACHVVLDLLTPMGVRLFYPYSDWFVLFGAPLNSGRSDLLVTMLALAGVIIS